MFSSTCSKLGPRESPVVQTASTTNMLALVAEAVRGAKAILASGLKLYFTDRSKIRNWVFFTSVSTAFIKHHPFWLCSKHSGLAGLESMGQGEDDDKASMLALLHHSLAQS